MNKSSVAATVSGLLAVTVAAAAVTAFLRAHAADVRR